MPLIRFWNFESKQNLDFDMFLNYCLQIIYIEIPELKYKKYFKWLFFF